MNTELEFSKLPRGPYPAAPLDNHTHPCKILPRYLCFILIPQPPPPAPKKKGGNEDKKFED